MNRKQELLLHYIDFLYENVKEDYEEILGQIDILYLKEKAISSIEHIYKIKKEIDDTFKKELIEFLNKKYQIIKGSQYFCTTDYSEFGYDYELCKMIISMFNNNIVVYDEVYIKLNSELSIDDCKKIVLEFYDDLFHGEDIDLIKDIIDNIIIEDDDIRSYTNLSNLEVHVRKSDNYDFLIVLAHEIAHAYVLHKSKINYKCVSLIEMDSTCVEVLLLKYLMKNHIKVIENEDGPRELSKEEIVFYFINSYSMFLFFAKEVVDEMNLVYCIDENNDEINEDVFNDFSFMSQYSNHYLVTINIINSFLERYLNHEMELLCGKNTSSMIDTFTNNVSYIRCLLFITYFYNLKDYEREKDKFAYYLKHADEFEFSQFINLFGITNDSFVSLIGPYVEIYSRLLKEDDFIIYINDFNKEVIKKCRDKYNELIEQENNGEDLYLKRFMLVRELALILQKNEFNIDLYPFDIDLELDDCDVDKYEEHKKKLLKLENEFKNKNIEYDF